MQGDGTFSAFVYNNVALGSNPTIWDGITGVTIKSIGFQNFYRGLDIGAANAGGLTWSLLEDLHFTNIQDWGISCINFMHLTVRGINTTDCGMQSTLANGIVTGGQYWGSNYPNAACSLGNSYFYDLFNEQKRSGNFVRFTRGIVFEVAGASAILNEIHAKGIQSNKLTSSLLTDNAVLITNGNTSIQVTASSNYAVGMPVRFTSTANGFNINQTYVVASIIDATHITLSNGRANSNATAISPTGSSTMTLTSYGFPNFELSCVTGATGIENSSFLELDVENVTEIAVYCENAFAVNMSMHQVQTSATTSLVLRNCSVWALSRTSTSYDADANSSSVSRLDGFRGLAHQRYLPGFGIDGSSGSNLYFNQIRQIRVPDARCDCHQA